MPRLQTPCPTCGQPIRGYHMLADLMAPLYFSCRSCKAKLRLAGPGTVVLGYGLTLLLIMAVFLLGVLLPVGTFFQRIVGAGVVAVVVAVGYILIFPMQPGRIAAREGGMLETPAERRYLRAGIFTLVGMGVLALVFSVGLGILAVVLESAPKFPSPASLTSMGSVDPTWKLRRLGDDQPVSFGEFRGKVVFLNVWATWCGPCVAEMPSIERLHDSLKDRDDIAVVAVSEEEAGRVQKFLEAKEWHLPVYVSEGRMPALLQTDGIPATFVINRDGEAVYRHIGSQDWDTAGCRAFVRGIR